MASSSNHPIRSTSGCCSFGPVVYLMALVVGHGLRAALWVLTACLRLLFLIPGSHAAWAMATEFITEHRGWCVRTVCYMGLV